MTTTEFNKQLSANNRILFGNAQRLSGNMHNAKDLMQETTLRAFASCHKFEEGTNFLAWVYTIMHNCFINEYRKRQTRGKIVNLMEDDMKEVLGQTVRNMGNTIVMMKELQSMMDGLCDTNRIPFELHFNGFGYREIAEQLDVPLGTVKSRIFSARKKLKSIVKSYYGDHVQYA
jgi:RNA polymerase sigma-70 factor, ECF subfamily